MKRLRVDERGYPIPWFVQWFHPDGSAVEGEPGVEDRPDFRVVDSRKRVLALNRSRCWVCGDATGRYLAFTIGPMCAINRISSEPPSHRECAIFSAKGCPFLSMPKMVRRENDIPSGIVAAPGIPLDRNPGVTLVWITHNYRIVPALTGAGQFLIKVGDPLETLWFCQGRPATREEVMDSIKSGLPSLVAAAEIDGEEGVRSLNECLADVQKILPSEISA
jgi:hypothetical protein